MPIAPETSIVDTYYDYKITKVIGTGQTYQWIGQPAKFERGPKVKRPFLYSNSSADHLRAMINFVLEADMAHLPEVWTELLKTYVVEP